MSLDTNNRSATRPTGQPSLGRNNTYRQVIAALNQSRDMIALFDPDDRMVFTNRAWKEFNSDVVYPANKGITFEEHIRATTESRLLPEAIGREEEWIAERLERHRNPRGPFEVRARNNRWISVNEQVLDDGSTIMVLSDITEVKQAELHIRAQHERFEVALQNIPAGICVYDKDHLLAISNGNFAKMYGIAPNQMVPGIHFKDVMALRISNGLYAGASPEEYIKERVKWLACRKPGSKTERLNDGRTIEITQQPLAEGGWLTIHEDVTERIESQNALQDSEQQFRDLVEGSIQGFHIARDWKFLFVNQSLADIFGYDSPEDLMAIETPMNLLDPGERERVRGFKEARERGEYAPEIYECNGVRKDGTRIIVEIRARRVQWHGETATQCVIVDVTDRKRAEEAMIQHRDQLQDMVDSATKELREKAHRLNHALKKEKALNEQQKHFISVASHEFRTPLSIIDSSVQRLLRNKDDISPEDLENRARKIRAAIKTMTNLMESTLAAARVDAGKADLNFERCNLRDLVWEVCAHQTELIDKDCVICELSKLPEHVVGDAAALSQVFTNLLSNAVKYSPDGPRITVKGWVEGSDACVSVQDRGLGVDEEEIPKMFARFFRASTSSGIPGTGIGLNLAQNLVKLHGGSISVDSIKGQGSTFTVRLPVNGPVESATVSDAMAG